MEVSLNNVALLYSNEVSELFRYSVGGEGIFLIYYLCTCTILRDLNLSISCISKVDLLAIISPSSRVSSD